jgi:plastocyanin
MKVVIALLACALALAVSACGGGSEESEGGGTTQIAGVAAADHGTKSVAGQDELELELDDDYFEPTVLQGDAGQTLKLKLENEGGAEHNLTLEAQGIDQDVEPGGKAEVSVTFPDSGEVSFYCKYHKSSGMAGALTVG